MLLLPDNIDSSVIKLQINTVKRPAIARKTRVRFLPRADALLFTVTQSAVTLSPVEVGTVGTDCEFRLMLGTLLV
jgi:hypothetical protein